MAKEAVPRLVSEERRGAVRLWTLNRPEKRNALNPDLVDELLALLEETARDAKTSVVVLTGAGPGFCAGLDLEFLARATKAEKARLLDRVFALFWNVFTLPQPVIAAVNGSAFAGGFDLAAFCDLRLASAEATFAQSEVNVGLAQIVNPLYKSIGLAHAKELAITGKAIPAAEAHRIGLVNEVCAPADVLPRAFELAASIAAKPQPAVREAKRLTRELIDVETRPALEAAKEALVRLAETAEHRAALSAVLDRIRKRA